MRAKVTKRGLIIPRELLAGAEEVEIRQEDNRIIIFPLPSSDPILNLGKHPMECGAPNVSEQHDYYLYDSGS